MRKIFVAVKDYKITNKYLKARDTYLSSMRKRTWDKH